jgi:hypothetical protein
MQSTVHTLFFTAARLDACISISCAHPAESGLHLSDSETASAIARALRGSELEYPLRPRVGSSLKRIELTHVHYYLQHAHRPGDTLH